MLPQVASRKAHHGFTLIETVVALAILVLALGVLYESFGWSLRRAARLEKQQMAWLTAQSVLSELHSRQSLREGAEQGETAEGLKWSARVRLHLAGIDTRSPVQAFEVTIAVAWGTRPAQRVRLQSIVMGTVAT